MILEILTRIDSILFIIEMIGATLIVKLENDLTGEGVYEIDLLLMSMAISLFLTGPRRISIERDVLKSEIFPKTSYKKEGRKDAT